MSHCHVEHRFIAVILIGNCTSKISCKYESLIHASEKISEAPQIYLLSQIKNLPLPKGGVLSSLGPKFQISNALAKGARP